jgi:hypothetical protein
MEVKMEEQGEGQERHGELLFCGLGGDKLANMLSGEGMH